MLLSRQIQSLRVAGVALSLGWLGYASEWQTGTGYRWRPLAVPLTGQSGFTLVSADTTGVAFTNRLALSRYTTNQIYLNGSGVALGDVDGDGLCDIYLCGLDGPNKLYRNLGNFKFEDITSAAGVACPDLDATSAAFADLDGDGDLDLVVSSIGQGTLIFLNDGKGHFTVSGQAPLNRNRAAMSMALADIDGDGDLDLYIANYRRTTIRDQPNTTFGISTLSGKPIVTHVNDRPVTDPDLVGRFELAANGKIIENGEPDALFINDGKGHFTLASFTDGRFLDEDGKALRQPPYDWGLSVMFRDLNGDRAPDLYVCNDFTSPDRIWINNGKGQFRALPRLALRTTSLFSMGLDIADLNRDGFDEILVLDMFSRDHRRRQNQLPDILPSRMLPGEIENRPQYSRNTLFLNRGDLTFAEIGQYSGLFASDWSWCPVFLDVDLDGYEDVLIVTGNQRDSMNADIAERFQGQAASPRMSSLQKLELLNRFPRLALPKLAFRNRGDLTFEDTSAAWGFNQADVSQGIALADLDDDGDLDVVINNLNGCASIYRNESTAPRVAVRLKGLPPNTRGIGAKIRVTGGPVSQSQEIIAGGRYLSSDDPMRVFAAGQPTNRLRIEVLWRSGKTSVVEHALANCLFEVDEAGALFAGDKSPPESPMAHLTATTRQPAGANDGSAARSGAASPQSPKPYFEEVSDLIRHTHHQAAFDDLGRQPLLQRSLAQLGPGVSWYDVNGDGWEDLIIGSGAGGHLSVYLNDGCGGFKPWTDPLSTQPVTRSQTTILGFNQAPGRTTLLAGSANYQDGLARDPIVRQYDLTAQAIDDRLPGQPSSTGPLALADIDGDGDLDLFVGGRVVPGRYPEAASSMIFRNVDGRWEFDAENSQVLKDTGLVSGAVWSDLNQDGFPELILACEAGPIRVYQNDHGKLTEVTKKLGLADYVGLWNGITAGDVDGDGQLDLIATNWGWNNRYQAEGSGHLRLYYGDFLENGALEVIECYLNADMGKVVPFSRLRNVARAFPFVSERFESNEAYGLASIDQVLGNLAPRAKVLPVDTFASMVFFNRRDHFEAKPLPTEAQFAPAFGVCIGDMNGDGYEDIFLSQNFFAQQSEIPRLDAGRGLWLRGDGHGGFSPVPGQESGIKVYGEQRGCALADYDGDGRVDLVVTQNGAATKLFHNLRAKPGIRVRVSGGPANPYGIGAVLRLGGHGESGPAREVHAGSGYWSQDGSVQVLGFAVPPERLEVHWPGGNTSHFTIPPGAREVLVEPNTSLKLIR
jgi:hypothetical protein